MSEPGGPGSNQPTTGVVDAVAAPLKALGWSSAKSLVALLAGAVGIWLTSIAIAKLNQLSWQLALDWVAAFLAVAHILYLTFVIAKGLPDHNDLSATCAPGTPLKCAEQVSNRLFQLLFTWILLYVAILLGELNTLLNSSAQPLAAISSLLRDLLNLASASVLFGLFRELWANTLSPRHPFGNRIRQLFFLVQWLAPSILFAGALVVVLVASAPSWCGKVLQLTNGLYSGVAIALLVGRLDSKFLGLKGRLVALLFLYALIQPAYGELAGDLKLLKAILISLALFLKLALVGAILATLRSGAMSLFLRQSRYLNKFGEEMRVAHTLEIGSIQIPEGTETGWTTTEPCCILVVAQRGYWHQNSVHLPMDLYNLDRFRRVVVRQISVTSIQSGKNSVHAGLSWKTPKSSVNAPTVEETAIAPSSKIQVSAILQCDTPDIGEEVEIELLGLIKYEERPEDERFHLKAIGDSAPRFTIARPSI